MRCIEIWIWQRSKRCIPININMRCIEIVGDVWHDDHADGININMRCIEIVGLSQLPDVQAVININMRCIEILFGYLSSPYNF